MRCPVVRTGVAGTAISGGLGPVFRGRDLKFLLLSAGRKRDTGDGEADHLTLAATQATHGVTHEEDLREVRSAKAGATKTLVGAVLAADRNSTGGGYVVIDGAVVRRMCALPAAKVSVDLVRGAHFFWFVVPFGVGDRSKSFSVVCFLDGGRFSAGRVLFAGRGARMGWTADRAAGFESRA
jgi:hypothetical protein